MAWWQSSLYALATAAAGCIAYSGDNYSLWVPGMLKYTEISIMPHWIMEQLRAIDWEAGLEFLQCVCHVNSHREKDKRPRVGGVSRSPTPPPHTFSHYCLPSLSTLTVDPFCQGYYSCPCRPPNTCVAIVACHFLRLYANRAGLAWKGGVVWKL